MSEQPDSPVRDAGWYPDPIREHTLRYWDGDAWTDDRAPGLPSTVGETPVARPVPSGWTDENDRLTAQGRYGLGVGLAAVGAIIAIVGVFLPLADTESSLHIAKNSLIQHWEGVVILCVALAGFLAALRPRTRPFAFLAGGALVILAVVAGANLPIEYRNEFSRAVAGNASPGAGVWAVGAGGAILALSSLFADWGVLTGSRDHKDAPGQGRMARFEEIMSGREVDDDARVDFPSHPGDEEPVDEEEVPSPRPRGRMHRFEEIMSGRTIPDPNMDTEGESPGTEQ